MRPINIERSITRRDQKSLNHYLSDISRHEVLSVKEEEDLFRRIDQGDPTALRKIVQHNLRFVVSVAKQYQNVGLSLVNAVPAAFGFDLWRFAVSCCVRFSKLSDDLVFVQFAHNVILI